MPLTAAEQRELDALDAEAEALARRSPPVAPPELLAPSAGPGQPGRLKSDLLTELYGPPPTGQSVLANLARYAPMLMPGGSAIRLLTGALGGAAGESLAQNIEGRSSEEMSPVRIALGGAIPLAGAGVSGVAGWLRRLLGQSKIDTAAVSQALQEIAPELGPTGTFGELHGTTMGQSGRRAKEETYQAGVKRAEKAMPLTVDFPRQARPIEGSVTIPALSNQPMTLSAVLAEIRDLGKRAYSAKGVLRDTPTADEALLQKHRVVSQLADAMDLNPEAKALLDEAKTTYAIDSAIRRLFKPVNEAAGGGTLSLQHQAVNMPMLQARLSNTAATLSPDVYSALEPLRTAAYRGGEPGIDYQRSIPLSLWKLGFPGTRIPLPFTRYVGTSLPNPPTPPLNLGLLYALQRASPSQINSLLQALGQWGQ